MCHCLCFSVCRGCVFVFDFRLSKCAFCLYVFVSFVGGSLFRWYLLGLLCGCFVGLNVSRVWCVCFFGVLCLFLGFCVSYACLFCGCVFAFVFPGFCVGVSLIFVFFSSFVGVSFFCLMLCLVSSMGVYVCHFLKCGYFVLLLSCVCFFCSVVGVSLSLFA